MCLHILCGIILVQVDRCSSRLMNKLLAIAATLTIWSPVLAQNAIISGHGCGTGCSVSIEQLGLPLRMGNGWAKVRVRTTTRFYDMNGQETSFRGTPSGAQKTVWQFADCRGTSFGSGFKSDGSDAITFAIGERQADGTFLRYDSNASGRSYSQWKKLCDAVGIPTMY